MTDTPPKPLESVPDNQSPVGFLRRVAAGFKPGEVSVYTVAGLLECADRIATLEAQIERVREGIESSTESIFAVASHIDTALGDSDPIGVEEGDFKESCPFHWAHAELIRLTTDNAALLTDDR